MKLLFQLFASFFKIGFIAFGGGYTVIPLLQKEAVDKRKWLTYEDLTDMMAIAQTLPGAIYVNASTMMGYRVAGFTGALVATIAAIIPTFTIILFITVFLWNFTDNLWIKKAFTGILLGITALVIYSIVKTWKTAVKSYFDIGLVMISSVLFIFLKVNIVFILLGTAVAGFVYNLYRYKREEIH